MAQVFLIFGGLAVLNIGIGYVKSEYHMENYQEKNEVVVEVFEVGSDDGEKEEGS